MLLALATTVAIVSLAGLASLYQYHPTNDDQLPGAPVRVATVVLIVGLHTPMLVAIRAGSTSLAPLVTVSVMIAVWASVIAASLAFEYALDRRQHAPAM